jgi:hypothetical protein
MKIWGWLLFGIGLAVLLFLELFMSIANIHILTIFSSLMICGAIFAVGGAILNFLRHGEEGKQKLSMSGAPLK